jgi:predicted nucleotidyltransferase
VLEGSNGDMEMDIERVIREKREAVIAIAAKHGARNPRIFGSVSRNEAGSESDIDLLVKMEEGRSLLDLSSLVLDLQDLLGVKVDVVSEDGLYWLIRRRIIKEAKPL